MASPRTSVRTLLSDTIVKPTSHALVDEPRADSIPPRALDLELLARRVDTADDTSADPDR
jgi:hypothetical protein